MAGYSSRTAPSARRGIDTAGKGGAGTPSPLRVRRRLGIATLMATPVAAIPVAAVLAAAVLAVGGPATAAIPVVIPISTWSVLTPGAIALSSPVPAVLDGVHAVVVGTTGGQVLALDANTGKSLPGWPVTTPGHLPVNSTPSVNGDMIYIGVGDAALSTGGGYLALRADGTRAFYTQVRTTPSSTAMAGVSASLPVASIQGVKTITGGSLGQYEESLNAATGRTMAGFPWFSSDSEFSTPAVANLYGTGKNYIIGGAEQTAGNALGHTYTQGGHLRVLASTGNTGHMTPESAAVCDLTPDQGVISSPAVGRFLAKGTIGIVVGTSTDFAGASDTNKLYGLSTHCDVEWKAPLNGATTDSPALVDALGNGSLQVAEGTTTGAGSGTVYLLHGDTGQTFWTHDVTGQVIGSITSANLGGGYQDLLVPTTDGLFILDGRTGAQVGVISQGGGLQSSPLVTDGAGGQLEITIAGYRSSGGFVSHWVLAGTNGSLADEAGAWPMFHHDPQLTGSTLTPLH